MGGGRRMREEGGCEGGGYEWRGAGNPIFFMLEGWIHGDTFA